MAKTKNQPAPAPSQEITVTDNVQKVPSIAVADAELAAEMEGMLGVGQSANPEDRGTPFLFIAQKGSKQINSKKPEYIEGLAQGNLFNTVTNDFFDAENDGVPFIPCFFKAIWNEWTPQDEGGGFHGSHPIDTPLLNGATPVEGVDGNPRRDIYKLDNGHELVLTHEYWGVLPDSWTPIIVPMSSSNLGCSKKFQGLIGAQKIQVGDKIGVKPSYFTTYKLKTAYRENEAGDWYSMVVSPVGPTESRELRDFCKNLAKACMDGNVKAANPIQDGGKGGESKEDGTI